MDKTELALLLDQAAERGAKRALEGIGLHDEDAGRDVRELRTLLDSYRQVRAATLKTIAQWVSYGVLGLLALGYYNSWGRK